MQTITHKFRAFMQTSRTRTVAVALAVAATIVVGMLLARNAHAQGMVTELGATTALLIAYVAFNIAGFFGMLLLKAVEILIWVATYNGFVTATPVVTGWVIMRDVANMFFILALLLIAFGTILGVDKYSYRNKQLSRLLLMAVVVNFSRTIAGLIIDFSQVVMLTFVNGFSQAAGGNFMSAFRINELYSSAPDLASVAVGSGITSDQAGVAWGIGISMILALVMTVVALMTVIIMIVVLLWRIVTLWLLIIMSPLAFFLGGVPGGFASGYYDQWWKEFKGQVVVGPFLAFFLWLALVSVAAGNILGAEPTGFGESIGPSFSAAFNSKSIGSFAVAIALMLGGVSMAQSMSSAVGKAKGMMDWAKKTGTDLTKTYGARAMLGKKVKDPRTGEERYRGGLLTSNVPLTAGAGMAVGKLLGGGGYINKDQYRSDLYREATDLENKRDYVGAAKKRNKADELGKSFREQSGGQKVATVLGKMAAIGTLGVVGAAGSKLRQNAMDSEHTKIRSDIGAARERVSKLPAQERDDIALGKINASAADRAGAIFESTKAGSSALEGKHEELQKFLDGWSGPMGGIDSATSAEYSKNLRDKYWGESDMGVSADDISQEMAKEKSSVEERRNKLLFDARAHEAEDDTVSGDRLRKEAASLKERSPEEIRRDLMATAAVKAVENGKVKVTEDTSAQSIAAMAPAAMQASAGAAAKFAENLKTDDQKAAMLAAVTALRDDPTSKLTAEALDKVSAAITTLSKAKDGGMGAAYGMKDGQFTDTLNSAGTTLRTAAENAAAFSKHIAKAKNADKLLLKVGDDQFTRPDGSMSEVGTVIADAISKNPAALNSAARNADGEAQVKTMRALVETALKAGSADLKQSVDKGRAYENFGGGRDTIGKAKEAAEAAAKMTKEAARAAKDAADVAAATTKKAAEEAAAITKKAAEDDAAAKRKAANDEKKASKFINE